MLLSNGSQGHVVMTYINADGMDGEMCGNGAGCAVRRAWELGFFKGSETVLDTDAGAIGATLDGFRVTMRMTDPQDERLNLSIPTSEGILLGHYIDTGVPHVVLFVDDVAQVNLAELGPELRRHPLFPRGCNANWASAAGENSFRMRTYERGVEAETLSCGTGATAIALVAYRLGLAKPPVKIRASGGGTLSIEFDETPARAPAECPNHRRSGAHRRRHPRPGLARPPRLRNSEQGSEGARPRASPHSRDVIPASEPGSICAVARSVASPWARHQAPG